MEEFERTQKPKFDPQDPWDVYLVKSAREYILRSGQENFDPDNPEDCLELIESIEAGNHIDESFNSWHDEVGQVIVTQPDKIYTPEEIKKVFDNKNPIQLQYLAIGQPDGPETEGVVWSSRLWNKTLKTEVSNSRFTSDKLSWAISSSAAKYS